MGDLQIAQKENVMSSHTTRFTGIFIPVEILNLQELSLLEKMLLSYIDALYCPDHGGCYASNKGLAKILDVKTDTIVKALTHLRKLKLIEDVSFNGTVRVIRALIHRFVDKKQSKKKPKSQREGYDKNPRGVGQKSYAPIYTESKVYRKDSSSRTPPRRPPPPISFDSEKRSFAGISEEDIKTWKAKFPNLDIGKELVLCAEWGLSNPRSNYRKSIIAWLANAAKEVSQFNPKANAAPNDAKLHKFLAEKIHNLFKKLQRSDIELGYKYLEFKNGATVNHLEFGQKDFQVQCFRELSKRKLNL